MAKTTKTLCITLALAMALFGGGRITRKVTELRNIDTITIIEAR